MSEPSPTRRSLLLGAASAGALGLAGCDALSTSEQAMGVFGGAEKLNFYTQRLLLTPGSLAREYAASEMTPLFKANGTTNPSDEAYKSHVANGFSDWRLSVGGLVDNPMELSLADLRAMPSRSQITRHDCVEGWSCIGQWKGVPLAHILQKAGLKREARYIVFRCADKLGRRQSQYYESIDLVDAAHPQTILAYEMNGQPLPVPYGAPVRLRVERQLGYKHAKYVKRIEAVNLLTGVEGGKGGYWEDRGYDWYAGI